MGDFDAEALKKQVAELFGGWKSPAPYARIPAQPYKAGTQALMLETPDKANALFLAGQGLGVRDDNPDYPALVLGNFLLGGGFLNSRLATRVRQQDGLSYSVGSSLSAGAWTRWAPSPRTPSTRRRTRRSWRRRCARSWRRR